MEHMVDLIDLFFYCKLQEIKFILYICSDTGCYSNNMGGIK